MSTTLSPYYEYGNLVFISGQIGLIQGSTALGETFTQQMIDTLANLSLRLSEASLEKENVVKVTVYLKNTNDFDEMNRLYAEFFGSHKPARTTLGVSLANLKDGPEMLVEIDAIAGRSLG